MIEINVKPPNNCGECVSKTQIDINKYVCTCTSDKELEMLDIRAFEVKLNTRPDWCPMAKAIEAANKMSDENKILFNKACEGFQAMSDLINNSRKEDES